MRRFEARLPLVAGTLVATVATAGSLYFSLGLGLVPCELCWYQRILMYPLVLVLGVAAIENRRRVFLTALPLSALGTVVAAYHSWLQVSDTTGTCSVGGGCSAIQYQVAGLSIPNLSLIAFVLITVILVVTVRSQ